MATQVTHGSSVPMKESQLKKPIATLQGFGGVVTSLVFNPDGSCLASGAEDGAVTLWDIATHTAYQAFREHTERVDTVVFSGDGKSLLSGARDSLLLIWDLVSGETVWRTEDFIGRPCSAVFLSTSGKIIWLAKDNALNLCIPRVDDSVTTIRRPLVGIEGCSVAFSPDDNDIAESRADYGVRLWDVKTGELLKTFSGHFDAVESIAFSPDGEMIASGSRDETTILWDAKTGDYLRTLSGHSGTVNSVAFSPDCLLVATGSADTTLNLWDVKTGELLKTLSGHYDAVESIAFSPDGEIIASVSDHERMLWDAKSGRAIITKAGFYHRATSVAFSPDGRLFAAVSDDYVVRLWDTMTGKLLKNLSSHSDAVNSIAISPDGEAIASGSDDCTVALQSVMPIEDLQTIARICFLRAIPLQSVMSIEDLQTLSGPSERISSIASSPDSETIISGSCDSSVKSWDRNTGDASPLTKEKRDETEVIAGGPDEQSILASDERGGLWFQDLAQDGFDRHICTMGYLYGLRRRISQSSDGHYALITYAAPDDAAPNDLRSHPLALATIQLVDLTKSQPARSFVGHKKPVLSAALSPNGKYLASGGEDRSIHIWRVSTGELLRVLRAHTGDVNAVAFSHDGRFIASGGSDQTIKLWYGVDPDSEDAVVSVAPDVTTAKQIREPDSLPQALTVDVRESLSAMAAQIDGQERRLARLELLVEKAFRLYDSRSTTSSDETLQIERTRFDDL